MAQTIFFSWQSDTPARVGKDFLREVLDAVCDHIKSDTTVDEALRDVEVDSDTQGVAGHPPVVDTIFKKIDASAVFIADLTFVGQRIDGKPTPNPNVLIEYGWALKKLGYERIICVMNTAYGKPTSENLPFDLRHMKWPILYDLPDGASAQLKSKEKQKLVATLNTGIRASLATIPNAPVQAPPEFPAAEAKDGPARFRANGESLGFEDDTVFGSNKEVFLSQGGAAMWFRLMPTIIQNKQWPPHELKSHIIKSGKMQLPPLLGASSGGYSFLRGVDGEGMFSAGSRKEEGDSIEIGSIAYAFETGEVWSIDTYWLGYEKHLPFIEEHYVEALKSYTEFLRSLGVQPPYRWIAGFSGIKGRHLYYPVQPGHYRIERPDSGPRCAADVIEAEGQYDGEQSATTALMPFFKKIFEKCGLPRPDYLPQ